MTDVDVVFDAEYWDGVARRQPVRDGLSVGAIRNMVTVLEDVKYAAGWEAGDAAAWPTSRLKHCLAAQFLVEERSLGGWVRRWVELE